MSSAIEIRDLHYRAGKAFEIRDLAELRAILRIP